MKKFILIILPILLAFNVLADGELTKAEKKMASKLMKSTIKSLSKSIKGLSDAQVNFKASPTSWSIKENIYHLAISEDNLWSWMQGLMATPANPEKRSLIKITNEQLMAGVESRESKVKTGEAFEPKNAKWNSISEGFDYLKTKREEHASYIKNASAAMHNHIAEQSPMGPIDAFHVILLLTQHTKRHQAQIEEVKTQTGYPGM